MSDFFTNYQKQKSQYLQNLSNADLSESDSLSALLSFALSEN